MHGIEPGTAFAQREELLYRDKETAVMLRERVMSATIYTAYALWVMSYNAAVSKA